MMQKFNNFKGTTQVDKFMYMNENISCITIKKILAFH